MRTWFSGRFFQTTRIPRVGELNLTIRQLIQLQRERLCSSNPVERFAAALLVPSELRKRLAKLNDCEIGLLLDGEVGARLNVLAPESTICVVAADRLRRRLTFSPDRRGFGVRRREMRSRTTTSNDGEHIMHAEVALYRAGIPFLQLPWQMNRFASSTFMVSDVPESKACLLQAGFHETRRSPYVLIHSQTKQPIQLYEDKTSTRRENLIG